MKIGRESSALEKSIAGGFQNGRRVTISLRDNVGFQLSSLGLPRYRYQQIRLTWRVTMNKNYDVNIHTTHIHRRYLIRQFLIAPYVVPKRRAEPNRSHNLSELNFPIKCKAIRICNTHANARRRGVKSRPRFAVSQIPDQNFLRFSDFLPLCTRSEKCFVAPWGRRGRGEGKSLHRSFFAEKITIVQVTVDVP